MPVNNLINPLFSLFHQGAKEPQKNDFVETLLKHHESLISLVGQFGDLVVAKPKYCSRYHRGFVPFSLASPDLCV